ncbi:unnamed protein product [Vitrella brassicaformis CCMP3155]|uniref:EF-hand domain-containing protein n=1 Tax=Vitrella brassicaformis (strain CCMP3155) TaxID=1169540 RepID=A0A0G4GEZ4_VITBC|nr:unnamed protein product [Vitrella brassicaformis CCMP3155]|eukprot:CEM28098.1 unnamed protein product [Vitrella brassicaformis CCMP3155]
MVNPPPPSTTGKGGSFDSLSPQPSVMPPSGPVTPKMMAMQAAGRSAPPFIPPLQLPPHAHGTPRTMSPFFGHPPPMRRMPIPHWQPIAIPVHGGYILATSPLDSPRFKDKHTQTDVLMKARELLAGHESPVTSVIRSPARGDDRSEVRQVDESGAGQPFLAASFGVPDRQHDDLPIDHKSLIPPLDLEATQPVRQERLPTGDDEVPFQPGATPVALADVSGPPAQRRVRVKAKAKPKARAKARAKAKAGKKKRKKPFVPRVASLSLSARYSKELEKLSKSQESRKDDSKDKRRKSSAMNRSQSLGAVLEAKLHESKKGSLTDSSTNILDKFLPVLGSSKSGPAGSLLDELTQSTSPPLEKAHRVGLTRVPVHVALPHFAAASHGQPLDVTRFVTTALNLLQASQIHNPSAQTLTSLFNILDASVKGSLGVTETLCAIALLTEGPAMRRLQVVFETLDWRKEGSISPHQFSIFIKMAVNVLSVPATDIPPFPIATKLSFHEFTQRLSFLSVPDHISQAAPLPLRMTTVPPQQPVMPRPPPTAPAQWHYTHA